MRLFPGVLIIVVVVLIKANDAETNDSSSAKSAVDIPVPAATVTSKIKSSWTWANPIFQNQWVSGSSYYDVFKIVASSAGDYAFSSKSSVSTYAYLYFPSFNPTSSYENVYAFGTPSGPDQQFQFTISLDRNISYYFVVFPSTYMQIGEFQAIVTGPGRIKFIRRTVLAPSMPNVTFQSAFSHSLPQLEDFCSSSMYYSYDIFSIVPTATENYTIDIVSEDDIGTRLYSPSFNPLASVLNLLVIDNTDQYRSRKQVTVSLAASQQYYLVLLNTFYYALQSYRLTFRGPSNFDMTKLTDVFVTTVRISSSLTNGSPQYSRGSSSNYVYYYNVFRITVRQLGIYSFIGYSSIDIVSSLYMNTFSPALYYQNFIYTSSFSDSEAKFVAKTKLMPNTTYYLVVTTNAEKVTGAFNFTTVGPPEVTVSAVPVSSASTVTVSSSLTSASPQFRRCQGSFSTYYYRLFNITVPRVGLYTLKSQGSLDTYGCLYINQFDPNTADSSIVSYDDQSGGKNQFAVTTVLNSDTLYYLAATTNGEGRTGSFKVTISGPGRATIR